MDRRSSRAHWPSARLALSLLWAASLVYQATAQGATTVANVQQIRVAEVEVSRANYVKPSWSPDGRVLAFETMADKQRRLFVHNVESGASREIRSSDGGGGISLEGMAQSPYASMGSAAVANFDLTWSPQSDQRFGFVGSGSAGFYGIYSDLPTTNQGSRELLVGGTDGAPYVAFPAYHPKTMYFVYCQGEDPRLADEPRLQLHGAAHGKSGVPLAGSSGVLADLPQLEPQYSPIGDAIAFTGVDRGNNDIYVWPLSVLVRGERALVRTEPPRRLTTWKTPEGRPSWSPDGTQIAFLSGQKELPKEVGLWVTPADGSTPPRRLVGRVSGEDRPRWTPDGKTIYYVRTSEEQKNPIEYVDVTTGVKQTLATDASLHTHIAISPDGRRIAFCARGRTGDSNLTWLKLYVADLESAP